MSVLTTQLSTQLTTRHRPFAAPWLTHARRADEHVLDLAPELPTVAGSLYCLITDAGVDLAPVDQFAHALGVRAAVVQAAAARVPYLGLCGPEHNPMLFCLPPAPIAAGFHAEYRHGRLVLRLPVRNHRPALLLSGHRIGPVPAHDRDDTIGAGELAHLVSRLTLLARSWLPRSAPDPMRYLFELVAHAWRLGQTPRRPEGTLSVHRAEFGRPIAWPGGVPASRLDLVLNHQGGHHQLVNLYPVPAHPDGDASGGRRR
jgi:hypothetical protein